MKKALPILCLALLVFTTGGYRIFIKVLEHKAQANLQAIIEEQTYDAASLLEMSVAIDLPYLADWAQWEPVKGTITIDGTPYQYVERKLEGGRMYYRCLPNTRLQEAISARDRFMQLSYDYLQPSGKKAPIQTGLSIKPPLWDIVQLNISDLMHPLTGQPQDHLTSLMNLALPAIFYSVPTPPPDHC
ncbi:MAG TPA: hypothetical protein VK907_08315 [Phnomibacter sp.]|nr:hypothetical protein [Phnomibacter sp.]